MKPWQQRHARPLRRHRIVTAVVYGSIALALGIGDWVLLADQVGKQTAALGILLILAWWFRREA